MADSIDGRGDKWVGQARAHRDNDFSGRVRLLGQFFYGPAQLDTFMYKTVTGHPVGSSPLGCWTNWVGPFKSNFFRATIFTVQSAYLYRLFGSIHRIGSILPPFAVLPHSHFHLIGFHWKSIIFCFVI